MADTLSRQPPVTHLRHRSDRNPATQQSPAVAEVQEFSNIRSVWDALLDNKVDAVVFDAPVLLYYAANEGKGRVGMSGPLFQTEDYGLVFPRNSPLLKQVNDALLALRQDGTYQQLYDKWFTNKQVN